MPPLCRDLQVFALEACDEEWPFALPTSRENLLGLREGELLRGQEAVEAAGSEEPVIRAGRWPGVRCARRWCGSCWG